jgi:multidrug efflux pump subunit AcrB
VLAATSTTSIVFFPVTFLSGVSKYIFTPLALGVVLSIFASYIFAMTVVPLFCATFVRIDYKEGGLNEEGQTTKISMFQRLVTKFNEYFQRMLARYEALARRYW